MKYDELNLEPLNIKCTSADCENDLHCFLKTKELVQSGNLGNCRYCGADLVDWPRVHARELKDIEYTFAALQNELIRHHFWHTVIDIGAVNHARRKGRQGMREAARNRIRKSVGPLNPPRDGRQTPFSGNVLYYAQHATATCCRRCIEEWHNIPRDWPLSEDEIEYMTNLLMMYVDKRLPSLTEHGEHIPRRNTRRL